MHASVAQKQAGFDRLCLTGFSGAYLAALASAQSKLIINPPLPEANTSCLK
ncbi:protein of unknown function [Pseudodesulfovibrio piezophilus C1TLV30]|uniref:Uncharacterized protein n=1 Tax=Pseudodesulfovibrio piezophilus (strain DSM 21447 / JCM 15486 / C1TLV30) TaxID=1322246 RepID=M1WLW7_PSEP2|nr:protein of unknown function [Pseudodesulfovibrio piezophilus C1TLV30]